MNRVLLGNRRAPSRDPHTSAHRTRHCFKSVAGNSCGLILADNLVNSRETQSGCKSYDPNRLPRLIGKSPELGVLVENGFKMSRTRSRRESPALPSPRKMIYYGYLPSAWWAIQHRKVLVALFICFDECTCAS